jgi:hypothetical protein
MQVGNIPAPIKYKNIIIIGNIIINLENFYIYTYIKMNQQQQLIRLINMRNAVLQRQAAIDKHNAAIRERNLAEQQQQAQQQVQQQQQQVQQQQPDQEKSLQEQLDVIEQINDSNNTVQIEYYINYLQNIYEQQSAALLLEQIEEDLHNNEVEKVQKLLSK